MTLANMYCLPCLRTRQRNLVYFPGGYTHRMLIGCVTSPKRLNKGSSRLTSSYHMFLPLLLLHFERKSGTQYALRDIITFLYLLEYNYVSNKIKIRDSHSREGKERYPKQCAEGGDEFSLPGLGDHVAISHSAQRDLRLYNRLKFKDTVCSSFNN